MLVHASLEVQLAEDLAAVHEAEELGAEVDVLLDVRIVLDLHGVALDQEGSRSRRLAGPLLVSGGELEGVDLGAQSEADGAHVVVREGADDGGLVAGRL